MIICWLHPFRTEENAAFCDAAIEWLTNLGIEYYDGPRPACPAFPFQPAAPSIDKVAAVPATVKPSYAGVVTRALPPAVQPPRPNPSKFKATVKGTRNTCIYSCVPVSAQAWLLSIRHNNDALYPAILSAAARVPLATSLLTSNPITQVFWSANGQFIIVQFKDDVSDDIYSLFTTNFSDFYDTAVDHQHYMREDTSSFVKWTSCPTFDHLGNAISAQQFLDVIKDNPCFKTVDILGLPELIPAKHRNGAQSAYNGSGAYCMLKLQIKDNAKGDILNSIINKTVSIFGWHHCTLPWVHKPAVLQCSSCMRWGHHVSACHSVYPFCAVCAGPHQTHSHEAFVAKGFVNSALKTPRCVNCIAAKKNADHLMLVLFSGHGIADVPLQSSSTLFTKTNTMVSSRLSTHATSTWYTVKFQRVNYRHSKVRFSWRQMVLREPLLL